MAGQRVPTTSAMLFAATVLLLAYKSSAQLPAAQSAVTGVAGVVPESLAVGLQRAADTTAAAAVPAATPAAISPSAAATTGRYQGALFKDGICIWKAPCQATFCRTEVELARPQRQTPWLHSTLCECVLSGGRVTLHA